MQSLDVLLLLQQACLIGLPDLLCLCQLVNLWHLSGGWLGHLLLSQGVLCCLHHCSHSIPFQMLGNYSWSVCISTSGASDLCVQCVLANG